MVAETKETISRADQRHRRETVNIYCHSDSNQSQSRVLKILPSHELHFKTKNIQRKMQRCQPWTLGFFHPISLVLQQMFQRFYAPLVFCSITAKITNLVFLILKKQLQRFYSWFIFIMFSCCRYKHIFFLFHNKSQMTLSFITFWFLSTMTFLCPIRCCRNLCPSIFFH